MSCEDYEFRTFAVTYKDKKKKVSQDEFHKELDKYAYTFAPHIPAFVDGAELNGRGFDTEDELIEFLKTRVGKDYICCMDDEGEIVEVHKDGHPWYVLGYTNLKPWVLPDWHEYMEPEEQQRKREAEQTEFWKHHKITEITELEMTDKKTGEVILKFKPSFNL